MLIDVSDWDRVMRPKERVYIKGWKNKAVKVIFDTIQKVKAEEMRAFGPNSYFLTKDQQKNQQKNQPEEQEDLNVDMNGV